MSGLSGTGVRLARRRLPIGLLAPALVITALIALPLVYLVMRAGEAEWDELGRLVWRERNWRLFVNTVWLTCSVSAVSTAIALPLSWLVMRSDLRGRGVLALAAVTPLAVPGYLLAYTLLSLGGYNGTVVELTGWEMSRLSGFWGATIALGLYNMPYMFLNLRAGFARMDVSLEEAARSLGRGPITVFLRVVLPQLRPAFGAGALLVALHVIGDFGVVSLMRYESFSYAVYLQYETGFDQTYAAWLALMLVGVAVIPLVVEFRLLRRLRLDPVGGGAARRRRLVVLGRWRWAAWLFIAAVMFVAVVIPVATIVFWIAKGGGGGGVQMVGFETESDWWGSLWRSVAVSGPAALVAVCAAVPVAYLVGRHGGWLTRGIERLVYVGYAVPALSLALALTFFVSWLRRGEMVMAADWLYGSGALLVAAYSIHFLAEAVGPVRNSLMVATPRLEEASRTLGVGRLRTFFRVTLPLLRPGLVVGGALVFLSAMKELPLTLLVSPLDFPTLATQVWTYTDDARFAEAAPYALAIVFFSSAFVGLLLVTGHGESES